MGLLDRQQEIHDEVFDDLITSRIGEMGSEDSVPGIPMNPKKLESIKAKDDDPQFVVVEVESGISGNKRNWKPETLRKIVDTVNRRNPGGHLGHPFLLDPKSHDAGFPKPQVVWLGALYEEKGGKAVGKFKGYVLKNSEAREYLTLGLIDGVSVFGDSTMKPVQGGYEITDFELETIDFARQGRSGMKSRVVSLTGEQMSGGGNTVDAKDIAAISEDELRAHAPLLVKEIERKSVEPIQTKVGEQTALVEALQPEADLLTKLKEALKLSDGENPVEKAEVLLAKVEELSSTAIKDFIKSIVGKKVKTERGQALVARLIGEMHMDYEGPLTDELKTKIEADFTAKVEGDEDIKAVIGEMKGSDSDRSGGAFLGGRSRVGAEHDAGADSKGVVRENENLVVTKTRVSF